MTAAAGRPEVKVCEAMDCGVEFRRNAATTSRARWERMRFCSRACGSKHRRKPGYKPPKPRRDILPAASTSAPPPRIEDGVWRPNAPGWPARPHIPGSAR